RPPLLDRGDDPLELDLGHQRQACAVDAETARTQGDLRRRLLAADIEDVVPGRQVRERLQQQRRLADAGIAADQYDRALDQAAAEHAVELLAAGGQPLHVLRRDGVERDDGLRRRQRPVAMAALACRLGGGLDQRVPGVAVRAL